jgi:hypothetical protein
VHRWLDGHDASLVQTAGVLHLAALQTRPTVHAVSIAQALAVHLALPQTWLDVHVASAPQAMAAPQVAPLHLRLDTHAVSSEHAAGVVHVAPVHTPALVPQPESMLQAPDVHWCVPRLQTPVVPHCAFVVQAPAVQTPLTEPVAPVPHALLSQSRFLWQLAPATI